MGMQPYSIDSFRPRSESKSKEVLQRLPQETLAQFFIRLWHHYKEMLSGLIRWKVKDIYATQDILSVVYVNAYGAYKRELGATENVRAWLCRIADNAINDHFRRLQVIKGAIPYSLDDVIDHSYDGLTNQLPIGRFLDIILVRRALSLLQDHNRRQGWVIQMLYFYGYRLHELANLMQITLGAVKALQHRALDNLRNFMQNVQIDPIT